ncbi:MAG: amidase [Gammaproteobacteria bacterium]|jgi:Asp-tRNA(Asn)/Glu-tRNA(Gln) amidotransferase A subunit family amidase|nr:amidase [Gammaproteobacteria bacterium]
MSSDARHTGFALEETTISTIHQAIQRRELTVRELVTGYLHRIEQHDQAGATLNAVVSLNEQALLEADALDAAFNSSQQLQGALHGIPVLLKDNIDTVDIPTSYGSAPFLSHYPPADATVVTKLRAAGAVILGKTTLPDFATSWWAYSSRSGETRNPYDTTRDPGGSSAGTGAAIAANFATVGLGTDCGGSIRVPSSHCGLVGIRSTPGVVSRAGSSPLVFFQDTVGPMARSVTDAVAVFDVIAGYDPVDTLSVNYSIARQSRPYAAELDAEGLRGARLGLVTNALGDDADPHAGPVNRVVREACGSLREAGALVLPVTIADLGRQLVETSLYVNCSKSDLNAFLAARPGAPLRRLQQIFDARDYHPMLDLLEACVVGPDLPEYDPLYFRRLAAREAFQRQLTNLMAANGLDALIFPDVQVAAPTREQLNTCVWTTLTYPTNTLIASQSWLPAITVPAGFADGQLPVGLEFMGRPYDEGTLFRLAYGFEQATRHRRAPVLG